MACRTLTMDIKEKNREYARRYREKNPDAQRNYYLNNKDKWKKYQKKRQEVPGRFQRYKYNAQLKNRDFLLTVKQFGEIVKKPCHYCGDIGKNGIDRKDNEKDYVLENCLSCCNKCNMLKGVMKYNDFIDLCKKISKNMS